MRVVFYGDPSANELAEAVKVFRAAGLVAAVRTAKYFVGRGDFEKTDLVIVQIGQPKTAEIVDGYSKAGYPVGVADSDWKVSQTVPAGHEGAVLEWPKTTEQALEFFAILTAPLAPSEELMNEIAETAVKLNEVLSGAPTDLLSSKQEAEAAAGKKSKEK